MRAGFYQFNPAFGKKEDNLRKVLSAGKDADLDLLVLPEFFATGYQFASKDEVVELSEVIPKGVTTEGLSELSRQKGFYIVAGLPERDGDRFFNSAVLTGPEGFIGTYRKTHLFFEEKLYFTPGDTGFRVWDTEIGRIGIMICFDWFFPESIEVACSYGRRYYCSSVKPGFTLLSSSHAFQLPPKQGICCNCQQDRGRKKKRRTIIKVYRPEPDSLTRGKGSYQSYGERRGFIDYGDQT